MEDNRAGSTSPTEFLITFSYMSEPSDGADSAQHHSGVEVLHVQLQDARDSKAKLSNRHVEGNTYRAHMLWTFLRSNTIYSFKQVALSRGNFFLLERGRSVLA